MTAGGRWLAAAYGGGAVAVGMGVGFGGGGSDGAAVAVGRADGPRVGVSSVAGGR